MKNISVKIFLVAVLLTADVSMVYPNKRTDSLQAVLKKTIPDTTRYGALMKLGEYYQNINPDSAFLYHSQAAKVADRIDNELKKAKAITEAGWDKTVSGSFDTALQLFNEAIHIAEKYLSDEDTAKQQTAMMIKAGTFSSIASVYAQRNDYRNALEYFFNALKMEEIMGSEKNQLINICNIGNIYSQQGDHVKGLEHFLKALKLAEKLKAKDLIGPILGNIGTLYQQQSDNSRALEYFLRASEANKEQDNDDYSGYNLFNIANVYLDDEKYPQAEEYYQQALQLAEKVADKRLQASVLQGMGNVYLQQDNHSRALTYFLRSLRISEAIGDMHLKGQNTGNIGNVYFQQKKFAKSEEFLLKALSIFKELGELSSLVDWTKTLSEHYEQEKKFELAHRYYQQYVAFRDSINSDENIKKQTHLEMNYEFDKREALTKAEQEKKDALVQQEIKKQKAIRNSVGGGLAVVMLFSIVVYRQRNRISKEKNRSDELLLNILPSETAEELKATGGAKAKSFDAVTVMFTDFKNFTQTAEQLSAEELVEEINYCYSEFDKIVSKYGIEKIKTIGDAYMCAGGLPVPNHTNAEDVVRAGLELQEFIARNKSERHQKGLPYFELRVGIHTGPVVAGIVGIKKFAYDIWGDTVNIASRMESSGETGKVNVSATTYESVKDKFKCIYRGKITAKNKGEIDMYFIES